MRTALMPTPASQAKSSRVMKLSQCARSRAGAAAPSSAHQVVSSVAARPSKRLGVIHFSSTSQPPRLTPRRCAGRTQSRRAGRSSKRAGRSALRNRRRRSACSPRLVRFPVMARSGRLDGAVPVRAWSLQAAARRANALARRQAVLQSGDRRTRRARDLPLRSPAGSGAAAVVRRGRRSAGGVGPHGRADHRHARALRAAGAVAAPDRSSRARARARSCFCRAAAATTSTSTRITTSARSA